MAFKPNYNQQRAERDRAKQRKKEEKLKQRQEAADKRKAARAALSAGSGEEKTGG